MAARMTARLAFGSSLLLVAALAAVTPAQNRFDLTPRGTVGSTNRTRLAAPSAPAGHVNRFAPARLRTPATSRQPVTAARPARGTTAARATAAATTTRPASTVRSNRFSSPPPATAPAAERVSRPSDDATPVRIVNSWGGRSIRIPTRTPVAAPMKTTRRPRAGTSPTRQASPSRDEPVEPRLNYWDRRRWDPWYLCGWYSSEASYPCLYANPGRNQHRARALCPAPEVIIEN
jgi:hypothetical protein